MANPFAKYRQQAAPQGAGTGNPFSKYRTAPAAAKPAVAPSYEQQTVNADGKGDFSPTVTPDMRNRAAFAGLADSFSMGFGDEIAGSIEAIKRKLQGDSRSAGEIYTGFRDKVRAGMAADQQAAPSDYLSGQILGGVATLGVGTGGKAAVTLGGKIAQGVKTGAGYGAAYGFGSGEGLKGSLENAGIGAATGAAVGGAIPVAGKIIGIPASAAKTVIQRKGNFASEQIARMAEREGKTVQQVQAELQRLQQTNPDALVIDALGESGGRLGRAVVNRGSKGSRELSNTVYNRQLGQNDRLNQQLGKSLGDPESYQQTLDNSIEQLRTNAKPLYERAYSASINYQQHGPAISRVWSRVPPRLQSQVVSAANEILIAEGKKPKTIGAVIGRGKDGRITPLPTVEQWDYIKRGLDAVIQAENTKGAAGGMSAIGRSLNQVKTDLLKQIDDAVPEFAQARKVYSDDLSVKNALELGRKSLNTDAEVIAKTLKDLDSASRDTYRVGYARAMAETINSMGPGGDAMGRLWAAPNRQKRLRAVFGDEKSFRKFAEFAAGEQRMRLSYNSLSGNSTTARQLADMNDAGLSGAEPFMTAAGQAMRGDLLGAAMTGLRRVISTASGMTEARADEIAKVLASPSIPQGTMNRAGQYQLSRAQNAVLQRLLRDSASRSAVAGVTGQ